MKNKSSKQKKETPMMEQYRSIKKQHPDSILFFRMGDFYEMFDADAVHAAKILNIALTTRDKKSADPIPMCGVPYHAMETYVARLINAGISVAICDQVEDPRHAKGIVRREVTRVITPGTLLDQSLLDHREKNFLCALYYTVDASESCMIQAGLAFLELSTAEFFALEFQDRTTAEKVADELVRLKPREVLLPKSAAADAVLTKLWLDAPPCAKRWLDDWHFNEDQARDLLLEHFQTSTLEGFGISEHHFAVRVAGAVMAFLQETQKRPLHHISRISMLHTNQYLILDRICQRNLELTHRMTENTRQGTLLDLLDETQTPMGARELHNWILRPLLDSGEIGARQDAVEKSLQHPNDLGKIRLLLAGLTDLKRITARISLKVAHPKDVAALRDSLAQFPTLVSEIGKIAAGRIEHLLQHWDNCEEVYQLITATLHDNPPLTIRDGQVIRAGYCSELDELRALRRDTTGLIRAMEKTEKENTGIQKLRIKYNKVFGYFIEVTKQHLDKIPEHYLRKQTLVNCERFYTPALKEFEEKVLDAEEKIIELENQLFEALRDSIGQHDARLLAASSVIAEIDILLGLAFVAATYNYKRPQITEELVLHIEKGRHPVMEVFGQEERFVPNDTYLDRESHQLIIITGPNMAGKSTYIRQIALLTIMAQIGSFIPAQAARIGIVDRIFTRVGAADNLLEGQSTFMVEMVETANILHNATERSLIILDEVGRGTSTFDGLALAWAISEFIS
ncbi:DNA mismatch repair protein MutS, partial [candidate division CSSED10-310 bacterium]